MFLTWYDSIVGIVITYAEHMLVLPCKKSMGLGAVVLVLSILHAVESHKMLPTKRLPIEWKPCTSFKLVWSVTCCNSSSINGI